MSILPASPRPTKPLRAAALALAIVVATAGCGGAIDSAVDSSMPASPPVPDPPAELDAPVELARPAGTVDALRAVMKPIVDVEAPQATRRR
jgi:hypothetical protein